MRRDERDAQVALAESIGIPPTTPIQVADFSALPPPAALEESVEKVIDQALEKRPDLIAKVAALRAKGGGGATAPGQPIFRRSPLRPISTPLPAASNHRRKSAEPGGSAPPSQATALGFLSSGTSSRAGRQGDGWSWRRRSAGLPRTR